MTKLIHYNFLKNFKQNPFKCLQKNSCPSLISLSISKLNAMQTEKKITCCWYFFEKIIKELHLMNQQPQANRVVLSLSLTRNNVQLPRSHSIFSFVYRSNTQKNIACHSQHCHLVLSLPPSHLKCHA